MLKAKEFWTTLCEDYDYRFFAGIPFKELDFLYKEMNAEIMHYIPAANEHIALALATGACVSGFKSGVLLSYDKIDKLNFSFNLNFDTPVLLITSGGVPKGLYKNTDLESVVSYIDKKRKPGVFTLG